MTKKEFKTAFINLLNEKNKDTSDDLRIESALQKMARHMRNRDGGVKWDENDLENANCFYNEYKQQSTFNRETYRINR